MHYWGEKYVLGQAQDPATEQKLEKERIPPFIGGEGLFPPI